MPAPIGARPTGRPRLTAVRIPVAAQARRTKEKGWVQAEPQLLLLPDPVRRAVLSWAVREAEQAAGTTDE